MSKVGTLLISPVSRDAQRSECCDTIYLALQRTLFVSRFVI